MSWAPAGGGARMVTLLEFWKDDVICFTLSDVIIRSSAIGRFALGRRRSATGAQEQVPMQQLKLLVLRWVTTAPSSHCRLKPFHHTRTGTESPEPGQMRMTFTSPKLAFVTCFQSKGRRLSAHP